jgi:hypothetical protein
MAANPHKQALRIALLAVALSAATAAECATLWVAPAGSDNNPGTLDYPLASLDMALQKSANLCQTHLESSNEPVQIFLRSGDYPLTSTLNILWPPDTRVSNRLVIAAADGEYPVLSGGIALKNWRPAGDVPGLAPHAAGKVWFASAPVVGGRAIEFRELWVNGAKAIRASTPPNGELARLVAWDKTNQIATIPAGLLDGIQTPTGLEMVVDQVWEIANLRIKSIRYEGTNARLTFFQPESRLEFNHPWPPVIVKTNYQAPFFLANSLHFLDSPGEWFEDLASRIIYYWPRPGEDIQQANVVVPRLENIMKVEGAPDSPEANICFKGITFAYTSWLRPAHQGHVPLQAGMFMLDARRLSPKGTPYHPKLDNVAWVGRPSAAVSVKNADQVMFKDCTFTHLASAGLDFESGAHNDNVSGCIFRDIGGNGIQLGICSDTNIETHLPYLPSNEGDLCTNDTLANNLVTDCGNEDWGCVGMCIGYARGIRIEHNEVFNLPYTGISVGWGWTRMTNALADNFIHANHVHDVAKRLGDTAGIYTLSAQPGTVISENAIHDIHPSQYVPDPDHWFYIYLDEGSSFITVRDNWCPSEKFLRNANGPGNVWKNNGPGVAKQIQDAAGLEPQYRHLLSD